MNWNSEQIKDDAQQRKQELYLRLAQIPEEKRKLDDEVQSIKRELIGLEQVIDGLDVMTSGTAPTPDPAGFTDKIRKLLSETSVPLVPTQIRDALEQSGVVGTSPKNLLISVHTVLERIDDELEKTKRASDGKIAYRRRIPWTDLTTIATLTGLMGGELRPVFGAAELAAWAVGSTNQPQSNEVVTNHPIMKLRQRRPRVGTK